MSIHLIVSEEEQCMIVNALTFFDHAFLGNRKLTAAELVDEWRDVANDTRMSHLDDLATKIANLN